MTRLPQSSRTSVVRGGIPLCRLPPRTFATFAGPDAWVTAHILMDLLKEASVEQMLAWTSEPRPLATIPFGKHRRKPWAEAPTDYLQWMASQTDMEADVVAAARTELDRRQAV